MSTDSADLGDKIVPNASRSDLAKALRALAPRRSHGDWTPAVDRPDPVEQLLAESSTRLPELVPVRHGRMSASPFAFFRGAACVMASDLAATPDTEIRVQICGDAHLSNFGLFASPERNLVFDLNDFDETAQGPWEWDVKRLAASVEIAARENEIPAERREEIVVASMRSYRESMRNFSRLTPLDIWYSRTDERQLRAEVDALAADLRTKRFNARLEKVYSRDHTRATSKLTEVVDGALRITSQPPLIVPIEELYELMDAAEIEAGVRQLMEEYVWTLPTHLQSVFAQYEYVHLARKAVGVGSVGTRCWIVLLQARGSGAPLIMQVKEAEPSVIEAYAGDAGFENHGQRVVEGQRLMQAGGDLFLGWLRSKPQSGQPANDYYVRQLWDWKGSADVSELRPAGLTLYVQHCGAALARAHARSGKSRQIGSYLGNGDVFDRAMAQFAFAYADQNEIDHQAFLDSIASGRVAAVDDL